MFMVLTAQDVEEAERTIAGLVRETPVVPAGELSDRFGSPVALKAESLQRTGSFKLRGASNKLARLSQQELANGIVTASAGNHGQAVALAAQRLGTAAKVFMPAEAPLSKIAAVKRYGAEIELVDGSYEDAERRADEAAEREQRTFIHAFEDPEVIAGQGTVGLEVARQAPDTRLVVVPVGGGGLAAGVVIAARAKLQDVRIVGVQAEVRTNTICDGIAVKRPGDVTTPLLERYVDEIVTVNDDEAAEAMVLLLEHSKLVAEGAGAVGVAALLQHKIQPPDEGETCVIVSGGNVDASLLSECIRLGETAAGRRIVIETVIPDRPGGLAKLLHIVADQGANLLDVEHLREGMNLHVRETAVHLVLQTQGPDHNAEIVSAVESAGFPVRVER